MMKRELVVLCVAMGWAAVSYGCSEDDGRNASCSVLCAEAQAGSCTSISGNCGTFCSAMDAIYSTAGCTSQHDAYIDCLNQGANACAVSCDSQETALSGCLTTYCLAHTSDANCITLATSF
jgi:hypothetical protein